MVMALGFVLDDAFAQKYWRSGSATYAGCERLLELLVKAGKPAQPLYHAVPRCSRRWGCRPSACPEQVPRKAFAPRPS